MSASAVAAVSLLFVFINFTPLPVLLTWFIASLIVTVIRYIMVGYYFNQQSRSLKSDLWHLAFIVSTAVAGLIWGLTGLVLIPEAADESIALLYTCMTVLYVCALAAGALSTYAIKLSGFMAFAIPSLLPMGFGFLLSEHAFKHTVGLLILIFALFLALLALRINRSLLQSLKKNIEYTDLLKELENERDKATALAERMQTLSIQDSLTDIANRRQFDEFLSREWQRATRLGEPLSLVLGDLDFFKDYNDVHGHQAGDECLKQVAQLLDQQCRRSSDLAARYGGEEFAIILANTDASAASEITENIRRQVETLAITKIDSTDNNRITMSFGIATIIPRRGDTITSLINYADKALYLAKANGRNCVVAAQPEESDQPDHPAHIPIHSWDDQLDGPFILENIIEQFSSRGYYCTLSNYTPGIPIGIHAHIRDEINLITEGEMLIFVDNHQYRLSAGEYLIMPGRLAHQAEVSGNHDVQMLIAVRQNIVA